ncbi:MAG TPA: BON domain-containing protein [Steroidobacteraceae bacterium]|nr:BON domain-containing protein [Steroidobacteraceae bacterium]
MNRRYEDERENGESQQYGRARHDYRDEQYGSGSGYGGTERYGEGKSGRYGERQGRSRGEDRSGEYGRPYFGRREEQGYRGPRGGYGGGWAWSDQVWSGQGRFDEGGIGRRQYGQGGYGRGQYGPSRYESRYREDQYGRGVYGEDQCYVGSLYRGERRGEEPYREHEWQRSKEQPGLLGRVFARGPKGYTRSDERIKEDISERLWRSEYIDSSEVTIAVKDGAVTLAGTVPERWMRHEIENIADSCMGVQDIENDIRVERRTTEETDIETSVTRGRSGRP